MRILLTLIFCIIILNNALTIQAEANAGGDIGANIKLYFKQRFDDLKDVAEQNPSSKNFRKLMKPVVKHTDGFFGATLIDPDFIIRQVYNPGNFLARGFDLKNVKELKGFYKMMKENPAPQLSEPAHGSMFQPRLIAMRYPVIKNGKLENIVSMMVRTRAFLEATGLDKAKAFKIICLDKLSEKKGNLSKNYTEISLKLPSTRWVIQYDK